MCVRCGSKLPSGLAWEDRRFGIAPKRFFLTVRDLMVRPAVAFPGTVRVGASVWFAVICAVLIASLVQIVGAILLMRGDALFTQAVENTPSFYGRAIAVGYLGALILVAIYVGAIALSLAIGQLAAGRRRGVVRLSVRTAAYSPAIFVACMLLPFALVCAEYASRAETAFYFASRIAWLLVCLAWPILTARLCYWASRGTGMSGSRAAAAAIGPLLVCAVPALFVVDLQLDMLLDADYFRARG